MSLDAVLPPPRASNRRSPEVFSSKAGTEVNEVRSLAGPPPYGSRNGFVPSLPQDFGDGGAFPEIHIAQFPLDMGRKKATATGEALALQIDAEGKINYDAIARQGHDDSRIVQSSFKDLIPLRQRAGTGEIDLERPTPEQVATTAERTKTALDNIVSGKLAAQQPKSIKSSKRNEPTYVRYTPARQMGEGSDAQHKQRIIKMVDVPEDPMEPPKFRHRKVPAGPPSPPPPVLRSPPRKVTAEDQENWKIPPSVSNWKNPKGYTIALDKRLAADGRNIEEVQINNRFAQFAEALSIGERTAREEIRQRNLMQQRLAQKEKADKEERLRVLAQKAREERSGYGRRRSRSRSVSRGRSRTRSPSRRSRSNSSSNDDAMAREREQLRKERRRDNERQMRMSQMGTERRVKAMAREQNRDISEKIALGVAKPTKNTDNYDSRLFNRSSGLDGGINEDNPYDKPLFAAQDAAQRIYRPSASMDDDETTDKELDRFGKERRFEVLGRAQKGFQGTDSTEPRNGPVEFIKDTGGPIAEPAGSTDKPGPEDDASERPSKRSRWE